MNYSIEKVAALIGAHRYGSADAQVDWLLTDSRSLSFPESTLFFALRTLSGDGHRYISELYRRGVRSFCVGQVPDDWQTAYPDANFLVVVNPLKALQRLAERHRDEYEGLPIIGITGSNGKTVVKEWLYQLLDGPVGGKNGDSLCVTRSPRSHNSQIGVPLSVWLLNNHTQLGIFEAGVSRPDEMEALRSIIQPTLGVLTHMGPAHQENFATMEEKCLEKLRMFKDSAALVCGVDDELVRKCLKMSDFKGELVGWSRQDKNATLYVEVAESHMENHSTLLRYWWKGQEDTVSIPFVSDASIENCCTCLAVALYLKESGMDIDAEELKVRFAHLEHIAMRLEVTPGERGLTLINDTYNSDVTSLDIALDFMARRPELKGRRRTLVLSDILQTGIPAHELYAQVATMCERRGVDFIIGVGPNISEAHSSFRMEKRFFKDDNELLESGLLDTLHDEIVLFKGSRRFGFENLVEMLALRVHETTLEVDLEALEDNVKYYRSFMQPDTKMVCMIKANAYGAGAVEVGRTLQERGVDYLAVAVADEGAELRRAGITAGIIIMNPEMSAFNTMFRNSLEPEVYNFRMLDALIHAAERAGIQGFPVHIKLDTGMCRLGFNPTTDMDALIQRLQEQTALVPRSVFSHFVGSDSEDFNEFSEEQFALFDAASQKLQAAFPHKILRHICNSAGIERFPERHLDMVRLGLGLYGVDPIDNRPLHNVSTLRTTILQIREVPAGTSVGYSRRTVVNRDSRIAAIPIGYADGMDRHLGNRHAYCIVNGQKAEYVGNICMDVCMIDVTDIPCKEGDKVEIFGNQLPVTVLSDILDTIPYEILTSVSERVKRMYYKE